MQSKPKKLVLGSLELPSSILCAPLAGCSDLPFRKMTSKYRPGLVYCEMVKMDALVRQNPRTCRFLDFEPTMHPIGAQLCGSKPELAAECARIIQDLGFDSLDLNCGCPVDKVTKDGSGSGMLKTPQLIGDILANMVSAVQIPVTVKIRAGWDSSQINAVEIVKIAESAGAKAICIHGRTRAQAYRGPANWDWIRECKQAAQTIKVIGNGDVFSASDAERLFLYTGCDAILIARGTMGHPWIVEDVYEYLTTKKIPIRTSYERRDIFLEHLEHIVSYQEEKKAVQDLRRVGCWFLKSMQGASKLREAINRAESTLEIRKLITDYAWEEVIVSSSKTEEETSSC